MKLHYASVAVLALVVLAGCSRSDALPASCEAYLARAAACYDKAGAAAAPMKQSLEQVRAGWKSLPDPSQMDAACKAAEAQFAATAKSLGCE